MRPHDGQAGHWRITVFSNEHEESREGYDADSVEDCMESHRVRIAMLLAACPEETHTEHRIDGIGYVYSCGEYGPTIYLDDWE